MHCIKIRASQPIEATCIRASQYTPPRITLVRVSSNMNAVRTAINATVSGIVNQRHWIPHIGVAWSSIVAKNITSTMPTIVAGMSFDITLWFMVSSPAPAYGFVAYLRSPTMSKYVLSYTNYCSLGIRVFIGLSNKKPSLDEGLSLYKSLLARHIVTRISGNDLLNHISNLFRIMLTLNNVLHRTLG
jgi:hypothetical protein